jgi:hypothetical protein
MLRFSKQASRRGTKHNAESQSSSSFVLGDAFQISVALVGQPNVIL